MSSAAGHASWLHKTKWPDLLRTLGTPQCDSSWCCESRFCFIAPPSAIATLEAWFRRPKWAPLQGPHWYTVNQVDSLSAGMQTHGLRHRRTRPATMLKAEQTNMEGAWRMGMRPEVWIWWTTSGRSPGLPRAHCVTPTSVPIVVATRTVYTHATCHTHSTAGAASRRHWQTCQVIWLSHALTCVVLEAERS